MKNMSTMKLALAASIAMLIPMHAALASDGTKDEVQVRKSARTDQAHPADNTARNKRDSENSTTVPTDQPNDQASIDLAAAVRSAIVDDDTLSMAAHNIKLVASNGAVVLRGPVESMVEKNKIETIVKNVAGVTSTDNQLEIKTP
jgi:osmotically-inducible protein OsmY